MRHAIDSHNTDALQAYEDSHTLISSKPFSITGLSRRTLNHLNRTRSSALYNVREIRNAKQRIEEHYPQRLAELNQQLAVARQNIDTDVSINLAQLRAEILGFDQVSEVATRISESGDLFLVVHCPSIVMHDASERPYDPECERTQEFYEQENTDIALDPLTMRFRYSPTTWAPSMRKLVGSQPITTNSSRAFGNPAHPHWLHNNDPCLGDFGESITEANTQGDIASAILMYILFLETYTRTDSAGRFAFRYDQNTRTLSEPLSRDLFPHRYGGFKDNYAIDYKESSNV